jgi:hypothetical protein
MDDPVPKPAEIPLSTGWKKFVTVAVLLLAVVGLGVPTALSVGLSRLADNVKALPSAYSLTSNLTNELLEAGALQSTAIAEKALLDERTIVITTSINELSSRAIVQRLLLLNRRNPRAPIDLDLSSSGGWGGSAITIIDAMQTIDAPPFWWLEPVTARPPRHPERLRRQPLRSATDRSGTGSLRFDRSIRNFAFEVQIQEVQDGGVAFELVFLLAKTMAFIFEHHVVDGGAVVARRLHHLVRLDL